MKHVSSIGLMTVAILLCCDGEARAQSGLLLGTIGGATVADVGLDYSSWLNSFYNLYTVTQSTRNGFAVGGVLEVPLSDPLSLMVEPMYVQNGVTIDLSSHGLHELTAIYKLDYLQVPLTARMKFLEGAFRPYLFAGPGVGLRLAAKVDEQIYVGVGEPEIRQSGTRDVSGQFNSLEIVFQVGGGLQYDLEGGVSLLASALYSLGLTDVSKPADALDQSFHADSWKSRQIMVLAGVLFAL